MDINIIGFLQTTPLLEYIELFGLRVNPPPVQATPTSLPRLTRLAMRNVEYGQLFGIFTFPSLNSLSIDPVEGQEPMEIAWGKLQVPPVTTIKMEYLARHDKLSITGSNQERTRSLSLTERAIEARTAPMIQALSDTSLTSVTSLSVGRGVPELGVQLPSASICALISGLPHLRRLDLFPTKLVVAVTDHLRSSPLVCPELRILSLTMVGETYDDVFWSLSGLATDRAKSERWLHRIDCVILKERGVQETAQDWDARSQYCKFGDLVRCNGGEGVSRTWVHVYRRCSNELSSVALQDTCRNEPHVEMYPTDNAVYRRYSYC